MSVAGKQTTEDKASSSSASTTTQESHSFTNALVNEQSPYLLQHAHNPVDWYPWGQEAFDLAVELDRPIFLSVGYSTCHWCHVMERESFEDEGVAAIMNQGFVNVKVDREERPDVDKVYMTFVQATTGGGGWPMSLWLTPDLKPIYGGTYFHPKQFVSILQQLSLGWTVPSERARMTQAGTRVIDILRNNMGRIETPADDLDLDASVYEGLAKQMLGQFDAQYGGYGRAPKFPRPVELTGMFHVYDHARTTGNDERAQEVLHSCLHTLDMMAKGGMHDHLGYGFARYSVDRFWHVPHFEKMLYDQAQLVDAYLTAYQITQDEKYARVARNTLDFVCNELRHPKGAFWSALDADSVKPESAAQGGKEKGEGAYYVWTKQEIQDVCDQDSSLDNDHMRLFCAYYNVEEEGNAPEGADPHGEFTGKNILIVRKDMTDVLASVQLDTKVDDADTAMQMVDKVAKALLAVRAQRPYPHLDDKVITGWNGLMVSAFARAHQVLRDPEYLQVANEAVDFVREALYLDTGDDESAPRLMRSTRNDRPGTINAFTSDYAFLITGLLDLYEASGDTQHLEWAETLQGLQNIRFRDPEDGGYFNCEEQADILLREKSDYDGAEPSESTYTAMNLLRLAELLDLEEYGECATQLLKSIKTRLDSVPIAMPYAYRAVDWLVRPPKRLVVAYDTDAHRLADREALWETVFAKRWVPNKAVLHCRPDGTQGWLSKRLPYLEGIRPVVATASTEGSSSSGGGDDETLPSVYLCEGKACQLPQTSLEAIAHMLENVEESLAVEVSLDDE